MQTAVRKFEENNFALRFNSALDRAVAGAISFGLGYSFFEIEIPEINVLSWLNNQELWPKTYFQNREGTIEIAGIGEVFKFEGNNFSQVVETASEFIKEHPQSELLNFLGGGNFDLQSKNNSKIWEEFPRSLLIQPKTVLRRDKDKYRLIIYYSLIDKEDFEDLIQISKISENIYPTCSLSSTKESYTREDYPNYNEWKEQVNQVLSAIKQNKLKKAVIARATEIKFENNKNINVDNSTNILRDLHLINPGSYSFLFSPQKYQSFISGTPERLCLINSGKVICEALGGSTPVTNETQINDEKTKLFCDEKARREHQLVVDDLISKLTNLCIEFNSTDIPKVLTLSEVLHLQTLFSGILKPGVMSHEVIQALHPTPAVCGEPEEVARKFINELEEIPRGWYAGPIGIVTSQEVEIAVGIRSMLINKEHAYLFSGAGIVEGSNPKTEWEELESKISASLKVISK